MSVPIRTTQARDVDQLPLAHRSLEYRFEPASGKQPVTRDRLVARPRVDLNNYSCRAVFDWIEIYVETPAPARACDLGKMLNSRLRGSAGGGVFVSGRERTRRYEGQKFIIRLQDPTQRRVQKLLEVVNQRFPQRSPLDLLACEIVGMELAIDFYPKAMRVENELHLALLRAQISQVLRCHFILNSWWEVNELSKNPNSWPRYVDQDGGSYTRLFRQVRGITPADRVGISALKLAATDPARHRDAPLNGTVYVGQAGSAIAFRLQDKIWDRRTKEQNVTALESCRRRARIEVTLLKLDWEANGILRALELGDMAQLLQSDFSKLQQMLFNFQLPTFSCGAGGAPIKEELDIFRKTGALGLDLYHRGWREIEIAERRFSAFGARPRALGSKGMSLRYTALNRMVSRTMKVTVERFKSR